MATEGDTSTTSLGAAAPPTKLKKSHELAKTTIKAPLYSYAHLQVFTDGSPDPRSAGARHLGDLDTLQARSYCTAALKQFLGATGVAIPLDVLKVDGQHCWIRVPRDDLRPFAAAITAWRGTFSDGVQSTLRVRGCSDWLGALVGQQDEEKLWTD